MKNSIKNKNVQLIIRYPTALRQDDGCFFEDGIIIEKFKGRILLEFRVNNVNITSSFENSPGKIIIKGKNQTQRLGLNYYALPDSKIDSRKDLGLFIHKLRINWFRLLILVGLLIIVLYPAISTAFKLSFVNINFSIGEAIILTVPLAFLVSILLSIKKTYPLIKDIFQKDELIKSFSITAYGTGSSIRIVSGKPPYENDKFEVTLLL